MPDQPERLPERPATDFFTGVAAPDRVRHDDLDLYLPADGAGAGPRPTVVLVHGGPVPADATPRPRDWATFSGYGSLAAAAGLAAVTFDHRLHTSEDYPVAADDVASVVERARGLDDVDSDRVALWFFSGGGALAADWLNASPAWLRAVVWTYPVLAAPADWPGDGPRFDCVRAITQALDLPKLLVRVGAEYPWFRETQDSAVAAARAAGSRLEVFERPEAIHGYETQGPCPASRLMTDRAVAWVAEAVSRPGGPAT